MDNRLSVFVRKHHNLIRAWKAVNANARFSSSPYVRDEVASFASSEQRRIASIAARVHHGTYSFSPARGVAIAKKGKPGQVRPIVISKVEDRIVQRCILDALTSEEAIAAQAFQPFSFGGIRKRSGDELGGVPAAISKLIECVGLGGTHVMVADIAGFFTKISKSASIDIIKKFVDDPRFMQLVERAIAIDLENARQLWRHKDQFPYGDIGVGQGNCLSPLLGNLILSEFDKRMNRGDCRCIRYIDDIIIIAPNGRAASSRYRLADKLLGEMGMGFAKDKTSTLPIPITQKFEYLGIEFSREGLRPSLKSRRSIIHRTSEAAVESLQAIRAANDIAMFDAKFSVPQTLRRLSGMAKGWAHHYSFCGDKQTIVNVDERINSVYMTYLEKAQKIAESKKAKLSAAILGYRGAEGVTFEPFVWPILPPPARSSASSTTAPNTSP